MRFILTQSLLLVLLSASANADIGSAFGVGAQSMAMGATSFIHGEPNAFDAYSNPAALGFLNYTEVMIGVQSMDPHLKSYGTLVLNANGTLGDFPSAGVLAGSGQIIGLGLPIGSKENPFTLGADFYLPSASFVRVSGGPVNYPFYPMYNDISRNAFYVIGFGYQIFTGVSIGANVRSTIQSIAAYQLRADNTINYSASAVEARGKMRLSAAAMIDFEKINHRPSSVAFMYRAKSSLETTLSADISSFVPVQGELFSIPMFSPAEWVLSASRRFNGSFIGTADVAYVRWSEYPFPYGTGNINSFIVGGGQASAGFKDIWVPRVGGQYTQPLHGGSLKNIVYRGGYFYYPSPVPAQTNDSNFVDNTRHGITSGIGLGFKKPWHSGDDKLIHLDGFFQFNYLVKNNVTKNSATTIGAPGYTTGGNILVYGLNVSTGF